MASSSGFAAVVYDNWQPSGDQNRVFSPGNNIEFGDQVILSGSDRRITEFVFPYFFDPGASLATGNETITFSIYANDGAGGAPGTLLLSSPTLNIAGGGLNEKTFNALALSLDVGTTFTWAVKFGGIDAGETAGLLVYDPPSVGASFADFWQNNGGTWATFLIDDGAVPGNFAARITAIPEPSTIALAFVGGLALLGYRGYRRRS